MTLIDTHVHLMHDDYAPILGDVLDRARAAGVTRYIAPGIDYQSSKQAIALAERYEGIIPAIGLHPMAEEEDLEPFHSLAALPSVKAIGEIGMDRRAGDWTKQEVRFRFFLELAVHVNKPVLVHLLADWKPVLDIIASYPELENRAVWHCFNVDREAAEAASEKGILLSFTAIIARKKMEPTHEVIRTWPLEQMMLETDGPWLSWPKENWPNEPRTVRRIAEYIATIKNTTVEATVQNTTATAERFFSLTPQ